MRGATLGYFGADFEYPISIHAPHAGSDRRPRFRPPGYPRFQSTLPMRGATGRASVPTWKALISIHAPHAGSDEAKILKCVVSFIFQSTLPMRGATRYSFLRDYPQRISIHAPHAGSDHTSDSLHSMIGYFNPRSPCGERPPRQDGRKP